MLRLCFITALLLLSHNVWATHLRLVTEDLPPLQMKNPHQPATGVMVELMQLLLKESKHTGNIEFYPWARAYKLAQHQKNTLIFSILRDKTREPLFQWVGKIFTLESYLASLKNRNDIKIKSIEDAKRYTIGSIRDDLAETYLKSKGFSESTNLYLSAAYPILWRTLYKGRTDLAFTNSQVWPYEIKRSGLDPKKIKILYKIPDISTELFLAASPNTDKQVIADLQAALSKIKKDGRYQTLIQKWKLN